MASAYGKDPTGFGSGKPQQAAPPF